MSEQRYITTSDRFEGEITFSYGPDGNLQLFLCEAAMSDSQREFLRNRFPWKQSGLETLAQESQTLTIRLVSADLSFDAFWKAYDYKVGNKSRALKLWDKLPDSDKLLALEAIAPYNYYLQKKDRMEKLYPETYLAQRRFETDYKELAKAKT